MVHLDLLCCGVSVANAIPPLDALPLCLSSAKSHCPHNLPQPHRLPRTVFPSPHRMDPLTDNLVVNGKVISDLEVLMRAWVQHFSCLARSRTETKSGLEELHLMVDQLALESE